jgi:hypothetical protein
VVRWSLELADDAEVVEMAGGADGRVFRAVVDGTCAVIKVRRGAKGPDENDDVAKAVADAGLGPRVVRPSFTCSVLVEGREARTLWDTEWDICITEFLPPPWRTLRETLQHTTDERALEQIGAAMGDAFRRLTGIDVLQEDSNDGNQMIRPKEVGEGFDVRVIDMNAEGTLHDAQSRFLKKALLRRSQKPSIEATASRVLASLENVFRNA